jgi:hypothetical protein
VILERIARLFRGDGSWRSGAEATMSPEERSFVEESAENRDFDQVTRATFGGGDPNRLLGFPDDHEHW